MNLNLRQKKMRIAYLIIAHKNPRQLKRLVSSLVVGSCVCFIHIDGKQKLLSFKEELQHLPNEKIIFIEDRHVVRWGAFSVTHAILKCMYKMREEHFKIPFDYVILLSGQDYPIKPIRYIEDFYAKNIGNNFIEVIPKAESTYGSDYEMFHFYDVNNKYIRKGLHLCVRILHRFYKRKFLPGLIPYAGSTWWSLTGQTALYILDLFDKNPKYLNYFKYTQLADEMIFQIFVMNSPFKDNVINDNNRFIPWPDSGPHPYTLTKEFYNEIVNSNQLFARKFDMDVDSEIFDLIDKNILNK